MSDFRQDFIRFAVSKNVLRFGEFKTRAGRLSPYFFNTGSFHDGESLFGLAQFYAKAILSAGIQFDVLFGPAYKGIPLVASTAIALAQNGHNVPFCFNRKEVKDHGEGGALIGAPLEGRVLIVDDVISAGTSVRESVQLIRANHATPCCLVIALDRMERGSGELSAVQEIKLKYELPVISIITLDDVLGYLQTKDELVHNLLAVRKYRQLYGVNANAA
ncbi:MAG TPA: orotate phosphoribosyltransferase [Burkholderiales bacterium]|nr:orotate phosphoribosyltransferase [Burkholderiales bacterium]